MEKCKKRDVIMLLNKKPFKIRSIEEKFRIIDAGRPTPPLTRLKKENKGGFVRNFNTHQYEKTPWLCGSEKLNKLFCWPCILFSVDKSAWCSIHKGFNDLNNLHTAIWRHEKTATHLNSWVLFKSFWRNSKAFEDDKQRTDNILKHNELVNRNRAVLKRLITAVCYLGRQGILFGEKGGQGNNYMQLLHTLAEFDARMSDYLEHSADFTALIKHTQKDLIQAINDVVLSHIKKEIKQTKFVTILLSNLSDSQSSSKLSVVFRYVKNGEIVERFVGFSDLCANKSASAISLLILKQLVKLDCRQKVVAQTFDSSTIIRPVPLKKMEQEIKKTFPDAAFIPCYSHRLNSIFNQTISSIKECRIFFASLKEIGTFFLQSPKRLCLLNEMTQNSLPAVGPECWKYYSCLVTAVSEEFITFTNLFEHIMKHTVDWGYNAIRKARMFLSTIKEFEFIFLLNVFQSIFAEIEEFYNTLLEKGFDVPSTSTEVKVLKENLLKRRDDFEIIWLNLLEETEPPQYKTCDNGLTPEEHYRRLYLHIFKVVCLDIEFQLPPPSQEILMLYELLDCSKYEKYDNHFPEAALLKLKDLYIKNFDFYRLKTELNVMYSTPRFWFKNICKLQSFLQDGELSLGLPELSRLTSLLLTIPTDISSAYPSSSVLTRIKTFSRKTKGQARFPGLAMMAIERDLLQEIKSRYCFYDDVIEHFKKNNAYLVLSYL